MLDAHEAVGNEDNHKGMANYCHVMGPERAAERVQELLTDCLSAMQPYGDRAEALRALARYVALRTAVNESAGGEIIALDQQLLTVRA
jgi:hypothetical protein